MDNWREKINPQVLDWLLEEDEVNSPVRFLALRYILDRPAGGPDLEGFLDGQARNRKIGGLNEK
ncbi:MAG: hypothetical protein Q8N39_02475 [Pelolinea sp.]|nr:hypothetical protein [Pelolinea sp.]